jgi:cell division protease FtsH
MRTVVAEAELPAELRIEGAVEAAYADHLARAAATLQRGVATLIECEKDLVPFLFVTLRGRLKTAGFECIYVEGRVRPPAQTDVLSPGVLGTMIAQLREAVRGPVERRVLVLPHLDLLTGSTTGMSPEAREVIPLLYENPALVWLGFRDPSFPLPRLVEEMFPSRLSVVGVGRERLRHLVTQRESRKFGRALRLPVLYKYVSGVNAAKLRRLLMTLEGEDYPADPAAAFRQLRQATLTGGLEVPSVHLERDVGGYGALKRRLREEVLDVLALKDEAADAAELARLEALLPRGVIFAGPGSGKTFFARALAGALGAALLVTSGAELKSRWLGATEENLRQLFYRARQSAPAMIVFNELDSFAGVRGKDGARGVEQSMLTQLLAELDRLPRAEEVFVAGTTNALDLLDPALLRPGRFELALSIPYPDAQDRREILTIFDREMGLRLSPEALAVAVERTGAEVPSAPGTHFSGSHLNALCRTVARRRLRARRDDETTAADVLWGLATALGLPQGPGT